MRNKSFQRYPWPFNIENGGNSVTDQQILQLSMRAVRFFKQCQRGKQRILLLIKRNSHEEDRIVTVEVGWLSTIYMEGINLSAQMTKCTTTRNISWFQNCNKFWMPGWNHKKYKSSIYYYKDDQRSKW